MSKNKDNNIKEKTEKIIEKASEEVLEDVFVIREVSFYDKEIGLVTDNHWLEETCII